MSDEAMAAALPGGKEYTVGKYLQLVAALRKKAASLGDRGARRTRVCTDRGHTSVQRERAAFSFMHVAFLKAPCNLERRPSDRPTAYGTANPHLTHNRLSPGPDDGKAWTARDVERALWASAAAAEATAKSGRRKASSAAKPSGKRPEAARGKPQSGGGAAKRRKATG